MTDASQRRRNILLYLCLALVTAAVYWPVLHFGFVNYDDSPYIVKNPHLRWGLTLRGLGWAFTTPLDQWMPVTWVARIIEYQLFGLDAGAHHLVNLLFHIANTLLLFSVLNRMTGALWRSAVVAALFALHPLHVEPVAWITGLKDLLSMFWGILTIWAYVRYTEEFAVHSSQFTVGGSHPENLRPGSSIAIYALTLLFYALAVMSKPMVVTLPFVLLLLDYWPLGRTRWATPAIGERIECSPGRLFTEKLPFFALAGVSCVVTYWAQRAAGAMTSLELFPPMIRAANAALSYVGYLGKTLWPTDLAVFYPLGANLSLAAAKVAAVGLALATGAVIWRACAAPKWLRPRKRARREPWLVVGWFWYLGTLVPVIGLVQVGSQSMADRYTYVPLIGLFLMLCWSVPGTAMEKRTLKIIIGMAAVAALVVCAVLTRIQVGCWKDTETLFGHALNVTRNNWLAHNNLGRALLVRGRVEEAMEHWEQAVRIRPDYAEGHNNLGVALEQLGRVEEAMGHYEKAVRIKPDYAHARSNWGGALAKVGKLEEAIGQFEQALQTDPDFAEAHYNLGLVLLQTGRLNDAVGHFEQTLRIEPDDADAHNKLGTVLIRLGRVPEAVEQFEQALRIRPDDADLHYNLGVVLEHAGRTQEAIGHYEQALRIKPDYTEAQSNLARLRTAR